MKSAKEWSKEKEYLFICRGFVELGQVKAFEKWIEKIQDDARKPENLNPKNINSQSQIHRSQFTKLL